MDEIISGATVAQAFGKAVLVGEINLFDFHVRMVGPRTPRQFLGGSDETPNRVTEFEKAGNQAASDVAGCAGDGHSGFGHDNRIPRQAIRNFIPRGL